MYYMDLEEDEERSYFKWKNIQGSEDYVLLKERGENYEEDDDEMYEHDKIIRHLQEVSPEILWRTTYDGTDSYGARPSQWRVICVPDSQWSEAQNIFDRFLKGDDLSNYCYTDKYPEIYDKLPNKQSKLKDNVVKLYKLLLEYEQALMGGKLNLNSLFETLDSILPQIYFYANSLPYVSEARDLVECYVTTSAGINISLEPYDEFFCVPNPYSEKVETFLLSDLLSSIYESIGQGLIAFTISANEKAESDLTAAAINDWSFGFSEWGRDILTALPVIHQAKRKLEEEQRRLEAMAEKRALDEKRVSLKWKG
jgi:hypothetical protein